MNILRIRYNNMERIKRNNIMASSNLKELIDADFGKAGTQSRENFNQDAEAFCLAQTLKEERLKAGLTQEQLAEKIGTKKTYISRLENGKADVQLGTLFTIFEGLGRKVCVTIL
jgi:DNA-binding XRE family transcriptional regulator